MQVVVRIFLSIILLFIFLAGAIFIIFTFGKSSYDTTSFTNAGFAIFAGCASVSFAWARNLKELDDTRDLYKVNRHGENLFLCALCFIIASLMKYLLLHKEDIINERILSYTGFMVPVLNVMGASLFFLAYINAWVSIFGLLRILFRKSLESRQDNYES